MRPHQRKIRVTPAKRRANQRNARKSTGPRTRRGKMRACRNATTHGILAAEIVINTGDGTENAAQFQRLLQNLRNEFQPRTTVEHALVERVAACYWRLRRTHRFETGAIRNQLDDCRRNDGSMEETIGKLEDEHHKLAERLKKDRVGWIYLKTIDKLKDIQTNQKEYRPRLELLARYVTFPTEGFGTAHLYDLLTSIFRRRIRTGRRRLRQLRNDLKNARQYEPLRLQRRELTGALPASDDVNRIVRYETMLDRQLHKALTELQRRREKRQAAARRRQRKTPRPHHSPARRRPTSRRSRNDHRPHTGPRRADHRPHASRNRAGRRAHTKPDRAHPSPRPPPRAK